MSTDLPNVLASRYASDEMVEIWSPAGKVILEREFWITVLETQRDLGIDVPDEVIERLQGAGKGKFAEEGIKIACEQIEEFKEMKGVAGVHLMAIEWEHRVPEIAERAGMLPRPQV